MSALVPVPKFEVIGTEKSGSFELKMDGTSVFKSKNAKHDLTTLSDLAQLVEAIKWKLEEDAKKFAAKEYINRLERQP